MATKPDTDETFDDAFKQFSSPKDNQGGDAGADDGGDDDDKLAGDDGDAGATGADDGDKSGGGDEGAGGDKSGSDEGGDGEGDAGAADDGGAAADDGDKAAGKQPAGDKDAADDVLQRLKSLLESAPADKDEKGDKEQAGEKEELPDIYDQDEKDFLKTYKEDWADVTKGEALIRRSEYREVMQHIFAEVAKHLGPVVEMVNELATRTHLGDLQERVPDYNDLRDNVVAWVETQPAYLQVGMKEVMKTGTADEVADLIERYRKETGQAAPANKGTDQSKAEPSDTAKKAAKELAPVSTKRSAVPQNDDPNDFDSAFQQYAARSSR